LEVYILHLLNTRLKHIDARQIFEILLKLSVVKKRSFISRSQIIENKQSIALFLKNLFIKFNFYSKFCSLLISNMFFFFLITTWECHFPEWQLKINCNGTQQKSLQMQK